MVTHISPGRVQRPDRAGVRGLVRRHPLVTFFVLANLLSWAAWTPYVLSQNGLGVLPFGFPAILGTTQFLGVLPGAYLGPVLSAFLVTAVVDGRTGVRAWVGRLLRWRVSWRWYLSLLVGVPAVLVVTGLALSDGQVRAPGVAVLVAYLPALVLQLLTTGLAEEPGWRDFAQPRLQHRFSPVTATLILGPLWGVWHLPLFLTEWGGWPDVDWTRPVEFIATCVAFSFVMTWVFNRTGESLPLAMLCHTGINNFFSVAFTEVFPTLDTAADTAHVFLLASTGAAIVLLIATRGRLGRVNP
ncbi:CPBP family intramembrane glutamic endopeptidase [Goodfellowiella coeruleoviolacea]|uniref:Membrane protease YdiL, CAAX protease family n=1 Tax=Goodfellowiella coeruleoviolacea TaxID=334858 RepID=A0AAE3GK94_9PSEU|nr:type II CAAX endopeptidase family protein [Goodfellowiella coeruleoviolacea]MCP2169786.1 Membrane protease YdiL, CAAX protease family [Goodfellowiella coeruleoviolacea]